MRSLLVSLGLMLISISLFSQINSTQYEKNKSDIHYRNGRSFGGMGVFTVIGGIGCMLAPGVQFNSSIGVSTYGSTSDVLFLSAGIVLIGVGVAMLISNERNRKNMSGPNPILKYETVISQNSLQNIKNGFPAIGVNIPIR
jgi:UDP-N-acetylmuramyl pentapeptide phosphotransferase/UDP-N-acetylglucosamine-1-phosphate transferase